MKKFSIAIIAITVLIISAGIILVSKNTQSFPPPANYEYFWGEGCPHCVNVDKFLENWDKKDTIKIDKFEVFKDRKNAYRMEDRANYCKLGASGMGTPLLFTPDGKCYSGDEPIIGFFKSLNF